MRTWKPGSKTLHVTRLMFSGVAFYLSWEASFFFVGVFTYSSLGSDERCLILTW